METGEDMTKREAKEREFSLRVMEKEDTDRIVGWRNQDFVRRCFIYQKDFTREGHENWIRTMIDTGLAVQFMAVIALTTVGTSYQMACDNGIIRGGGDTSFSARMNLISMWGCLLYTSPSPRDA